MRQNNNNRRITKPKLTRTGRRFFHPFSSHIVKIARGKDPSERLGWKFSPGESLPIGVLHSGSNYVWICITGCVSPHCWRKQKFLFFVHAPYIVDVTNQGGQEQADEEVEATHDVLGHEWSLRLEKSWSGADPRRRGAPTNQHRLPPPAATLLIVQQEVEIWIIFGDHAKPWAIYKFFIAGIMKKSTTFFNNIYDAEKSNSNTLAKNSAA